MLCSNCGKNEAIVHMTKIYNGEKFEDHLCSSCAALQNISYNPFENFGLWQQFFGIPREEAPDVTCSACGGTYRQFENSGKFSCPDCYDAFQTMLFSLFKRIHNSRTHNFLGEAAQDKVEPMKIQVKMATSTDETSKSISTDCSEKITDIDKLKERLALLIQEESFEEAAKVRDLIKELKEEEGVSG